LATPAQSRLSICSIALFFRVSLTWSSEWADARLDRPEWNADALGLGGWAIDDVCVVANVDGVCGDGKITAHETCDHGADNADAPDACRSWCPSRSGR